MVLLFVLLWVVEDIVSIWSKLKNYTEIAVNHRFVLRRLNCFPVFNIQCTNSQV